MMCSKVSVELLDAISRSRSSSYPACLLNEAGALELSRCVSIMKTDLRAGRGVLKRWLFTQSHTPPLEFIWKLNEEEIMFVTTYFFLLPYKIDELVGAFETVYSAVDDTPQKASACTVLASIIATIINTLMNPNEKVQTFCKESTEKIIDLAIKMIDEGTMRGHYFNDLLNSVYIFNVCLVEYFRLSLKHLLSYPTQELDFPSVVRSHTKKWTTKTMDGDSSFFISKTLSSLPLEVIISEMKSALSLSPFKWKYFLSLASVLIAEHPKAAPLVKSVVDEWLKCALEENNQDLLNVAIITARHCCAEKTSYFPSYISWFGSVQPNNPSHFTAFFTFLSEMVPLEPPLYLKIHINKVPTAPSGCQGVLTDYITLAKTRLADLNETTDYLSIFNECYDTGEESLAADVAQLVNHFVATNEIAKPVVEASVFRKQYYEKIFLKYLLRISPQDDPVRSQVIRKLHSIGKIPSSMFSSWSASS